MVVGAGAVEGSLVVGWWARAVVARPGRTDASSEAVAADSCEAAVTGSEAVAAGDCVAVAAGGCGERPVVGSGEVAAALAACFRETVVGGSSEAAGVGGSCAARGAGSLVAPVPSAVTCASGGVGAARCDPSVASGPGAGSGTDLSRGVAGGRTTVPP
ncbi:hypothetical protein DBP22_00355 [Streptomyces sp. CS207]|nr:hypothetical protein DBP22_00355 [Streptomyces sp. CS207]